MHGNRRTSRSFRAFLAASLARFTILLRLCGDSFVDEVQETGWILPRAGLHALQCENVTHARLNPAPPSVTVLPGWQSWRPGYYGLWPSGARCRSVVG